MKLLMFGHVSDTGFGVVTRELGSRFVRLGVDVRIVAVNHRGEPVKGDLAGRVWPAAMYGAPYGGNLSAMAIDGSFWRAFDLADHWTPDAVLVIADMSGLFGHLGDTGLTGPWLSVPVYHYCPIEGDNLMPSWREIWEKIEPIAMSEYGANVISGFLGNRPVSMIYHGVDTEAFRPVSPTDPVQFGVNRVTTKEQAKRVFGVMPDRKLILRTDRLVERKFYDRFLQAMALVFDADPDVDVMIHCRPVDQNLSLYEDLARYIKPDHLSRIHLTNAHDTWRGLPTEGLVALMNAADLYVSTTGGEGFGLTLAESLACEVPVVVTDWAADRETVGSGGVLIPPLADSYGEPVRYHSTYGMDWAVPDYRAFVDPILRLLSKPARRRALGDEGRRHVMRSFSWDAAAAQFLSVFEVSDVRAIAS